MSLKKTLDGIPNFIKWSIGIGLSIVLVLFLVFKGQQVWNGLGNKIFEWKIGKKQDEVNRELADVPKTKALLEQSLKELKSAKEERDAAKNETDRLKEIFNDSSKTSAAKVAEFNKAISDDPTRTPTDNLTIDDLCKRAKSIGASAATIATLCGQ